MPKQRHTNLSSKYIASTLCAMVMTAALCGTAGAFTRIRDISHPLGERNNKLIGTGVVIGLPGTGGGGGARSMMAVLQKMGAPPDGIEELKNAKNFAMVTVTAELGRNGVRQGDQIDVRVHSIYSAKSLEGGTLMLTPLRSAHYEDDTLIGWAQGPVSVPDTKYPTSGIVKKGVDLEIDFFHSYVQYDTQNDRARFVLVLDDEHANFQVAKAIAEIINEETSAPGAIESMGTAGSVAPTETIAFVRDAKNIEVYIPAKQMRNASLFIARMLNLPVDLPDPEATIAINKKAGTIVFTGNVEVSPAVVYVNGLSIKVLADPQQQIGPGVKQSEWARFDTANAAPVRITELIKALDQLNVPIKDKISAIYALQEVNAIRGKVITVD